MQEHQAIIQLRTAGDRRRGACVGASVRPESQQVSKPSKANEEAFNEAVNEGHERQLRASSFSRW